MREKINNLTQSDKTYFKTLNIIFGGIMHEYRYKYTRDLLPEGTDGTVARITAVYKDRFEIVSAHGNGYARLKKGSYYAGDEPFPTTGDFVLLSWQNDGDSIIPAWIHLLQVTRNRQSLLTLTMYLSCSH